MDTHTHAHPRDTHTSNHTPQIILPSRTHTQHAHTYITGQTQNTPMLYTHITPHSPSKSNFPGNTHSKPYNSAQPCLRHTVSHIHITQNNPQNNPASPNSIKTLSSCSYHRKSQPTHSDTTRKHSHNEPRAYPLLHRPKLKHLILTTQTRQQPPPKF